MSDWIGKRYETAPTSVDEDLNMSGPEVSNALAEVLKALSNLSAHQRSRVLGAARVFYSVKDQKVTRGT